MGFPGAMAFEWMGRLCHVSSSSWFQRTISVRIQAHISILMSSLLKYYSSLRLFSDMLDWFYFSASQRVAGCISSKYHRLGLGAEMIPGFKHGVIILASPKYIIFGFLYIISIIIRD